MNVSTAPREHTSIEERASFDAIRYASCWEDADVLVHALDVQPMDRCFSIASAGDNTLALLAFHPSSVVACDLSPAQLSCLELRMAAFRDLSYPDMLAFLGFRDVEHNRLDIYRSLRGALSPMARWFWDAHHPLVAGGIIHQGKFERYLRLFGQRILRLIHRPRVIERLLEAKTEEEQRTFYTSTWNNWRWRLLFKLFFSRAVMGKAGRDPEFLRYVEGSTAERILKRVEEGVTRIPTHTNPYLHYILTGQFGPVLPFYAREEHFETIKGNLDRVHLFLGSTDEALATFDHTFDAFNLSDIFEYMSVPLFRRTSQAFLAAAHPGARIAYWNMLVPRDMASQFPNHVDPLKAKADLLFRQDKAFFYQSFQLDQVHTSWNS